MDSTSVPHITLKTPSASGTDPMVAAALMRGGNDGLLGGGVNGLLPLLIGAFLFGNGRNGLFGNTGGAGGDAVAAASITTSKDVMSQLNTFQSWAQTNAASLAQQLCCSTASITAAVNALSPQMYQIASQQALALSQGFAGVERTMDSGFAAGALAQCQTQNLVGTSSADVKFATSQGFNAIAQQLAACCCENRLAVANQTALIERSAAAIQVSAAANYAALANQLNVQTCELKQATAASTAAILEKLNQQEMDALRSQLTDTKAALSNCQQTGNFSTILNAVENQQTAQIIAAIQGACSKSCNGNSDK